MVKNTSSIDYNPIYRNGVARGSLIGNLPENKKGKNRIGITGPRIPFKEFSSLWFVHKKTAYSVQTIPVQTLREAVNGFIHHEITLELFQKTSLDLYDRWYILCEAKGLKVYKSKEEAERSTSHES